MDNKIHIENNNEVVREIYYEIKINDLNNEKNSLKTQLANRKEYFNAENEC